MGRRTGDSYFVSARCNEKNRPKNRWMTRSVDRSGFAISEALTIKIASWPEPILGPEPCHDLRVQRTYGSSCGDDFVFMGGLNVAEPDLAQRPAGTHRRRVTLTGPRLQPKGPFGEPSNGRRGLAVPPARKCNRHQDDGERPFERPGCAPPVGHAPGLTGRWNASDLTS